MWTRNAHQSMQTMRRTGAAALLLAVGFGAARIAPQDDLERRLLDQAVRLDETQNALTETQQRVRLLEAHAVAVADATQTLRAKVRDSRTNGFEFAGANPQARTDLLEGLLSFAAVVAPERGEDDVDDDAKR